MATIPINHKFKLYQSRLQTRINHDFNPIRLWLQYGSIKTSNPINQDSYNSIHLMDQSGSIMTSNPD
jgi:hypothetical protein